MWGKFLFCNDDEKGCVKKVGIIDLNCIYVCDELVIGDVIFVVMGVINGLIVVGVKCELGYLIIEIILMCLKIGLVCCMIYCNLIK